MLNIFVLCVSDDRGHDVLGPLKTFFFATTEEIALRLMRNWLLNDARSYDWTEEEVASLALLPTEQLRDRYFARYPDLNIYIEGAKLHDN